MGESECIFCRIVAGLIPAARVFEDETVLAFLDIGPVSDGHTLVIPKEHYATMHTCPADVLAAVASTLGSIAGAVVKATGAEAYNVLCNNGRPAGQLVSHMHFHVIPRKSGDHVFDRWPSYAYPDGKMEALAAAIRAKF